MTKFAPGSIVRLRKTIGEAWSSDRLDAVVVLAQFEPPYDSGNPDVRVAPVGYVTSLASEADLLCSEKKHGIDVPFMVEVWNQRAVLLSQLEAEPAGQLTEEKLRELYAVHNRHIGADDETSVEVKVGRTIEEETDPRLAYQLRRYELAECLTNTVNVTLFDWQRRVVTLNFSQFSADLSALFEKHYAGLSFVPVRVTSEVSSYNPEAIVYPSATSALADTASHSIRDLLAAA